MKRISTIIFMAVLLGGFWGGCTAVPEAIETGIHGNYETILSQGDNWSILLKNEECEAFDKLYEHHRKTCEKCENKEQMKKHLLLLSQAHLLRAKKLKEWAEK